MSLLDTQESELDTDPSTSDASEVYLPQYLPLEIVGYDREFFQTFRVTKKVYSYIVGRFERSMHFKYRESAKCVLLGLNYLGHQTTTYSGLAKRFNVSATTASQIVDDFTGFLGELFYQFIKWPTGSRRQSNIRKFRKCHNIPNVIGCMSACYIRFTPSKITDEISSYRDAKNGCYASLLQAICDTDLIFFYILGGCPLESSTTEANSPPANLTDPLRKYAREWCNGVTVLGDESYPLRPWLLTPYKQVTGDDYHSRVSYNEVHNCATSYIRSAFRLLIGRFQRLKLIRRKDIQSVRTIVHACCVLHNISRSMENGLPMEFMTSDDEIALYNGNNNCNHAVGGISGSDMEISPDAYEAELLREAVANNLYKIKQNSS